MTRETKVGLVVATTFLCLVSLVVASKLRVPEASAAVAETRPQAAGAGDLKNDGFEPSEPRPDKPPTAAPMSPLPTVPPTVSINGKPPAETLPRALPPAPAPGLSPGIGEPGSLPVVPAITPLPTAAAESSGWWGRHGEASDALTGLAPVSVAQVQDPIKLPPIAPIVPVTGDPPIATLPMDPLPTPPNADPIRIAPPAKDKKNPDPLATVIPIAVPPNNNGTPVAAPAPVPTMPPADPVLPSLPKDPAITPPSKPGVPGAASPKPASIGTIGIAGTEVPVAPLQPPPIAIGAAPTIGVAGAVTALPAPGKELPKVLSHSDSIHRIDAGQTSFAQLSQRWYGTDKYAEALQEYNRRHLLNRSNADLQRNPPTLTPNQPIYYPPPNVLEANFAAYIAKAPSAAPNTGRAPVVVISPPTPLSATPSDATVAYRVPQTDHIMRIAQQTLGTMNEWTEIARLNPSLRTDVPIPAGTVLRLPAKARTN